MALGLCCSTVTLAGDQCWVRAILGLVAPKLSRTSMFLNLIVVLVVFGVHDFGVSSEIKSTHAIECSDERDQKIIQFLLSASHDEQLGSISLGAGLRQMLPLRATGSLFRRTDWACWSP